MLRHRKAGLLQRTQGYLLIFPDALKGQKISAPHEAERNVWFGKTIYGQEYPERIPDFSPTCSVAKCGVIRMISPTEF
ncbi:hypothetical protein Barb4_01548 [Bacteroidales bacterium Barb4]|nr:hypothetical protein Barb4_01548 [Bacteroidales bacterium Barb4]